MPETNNAEWQRLSADGAAWRRWGPYVSDRAWGTVREDYSPNGSAWEYFPHDHARSRVYRWNEDGLAGVCDRHQNACLALALWNERDPILKERLFGLTGNEGNHGEDVKEYYYYLDNLPSHAYMKMVYRYPQVAYPYAELVAENGRRSAHEPEYELINALGEALADGRYFDVTVEYAKAGPEDLLCRITAVNHGPDPAPLHILPHLWFRNSWSWGEDDAPRLALQALDEMTVHSQHPRLGERWWSVDGDQPPAALLFTDNETNRERLWSLPNAVPHVKDGINDYLVHGRPAAVNPHRTGTKVAAHFHAVLPPGETFTVRVRFTPEPPDTPFGDFDAVFTRRRAEADAFYETVHNASLTDDERRIQRQAFAGLLWTKQFYHYAVDRWLQGDPAGPPPPKSRLNGRNSDWRHLDNADVLSMPDKWEYPWYAVWDLAFHALPIAMIDPEFAKQQLLLVLREWYMHPNGQIPAYEWAFGDVNPPVHAWAAWRVYKIDRNLTGRADTVFLEKIFHKLLLNFTWWVNRKDTEDKNIFQGGFLGLDNIGVFDRSAPLPTGGHIEQADGTAWMGMYCLNLLAIALELARTRPAYEDVATKFFEHFIYIANAINASSGEGGLWHEEDGFYYDTLHLPGGRLIPLRIRSFVGLIPLFAVETLEVELLEALPTFKRRFEWFLENRPHLVERIASLTEPGVNGRRLLSLVDQPRLARVLGRLLDPDQFLSPYGLRSLSKEHEAHPYSFTIDGQSHTVGYEPAESTSGLFGGNSNWRGPVWFPVNYLMLESLQKYYYYCGDALKVPLPAGSDTMVNLDELADELARRLVAIFLQDENGRRPVHGGVKLFQRDPRWRDQILFYEYFHGDNGAGIGASHQTGWTALVAKLLQQLGGKRDR